MVLSFLECLTLCVCRKTGFLCGETCPDMVALLLRKVCIIDPEITACLTVLGCLSGGEILHLLT